MCDCSDYAVGALLGQRRDKKVYAIYYASHTLDDAQINYATTKKELLAAVFAIGKSCHLPIELEHRAYWATKLLNFDLQ